MNHCNLFCSVCGVQRTIHNHVKNSGICRDCKRKESRDYMRNKRNDPDSGQKEYDIQWKKAHPETVRRWNNNWKKINNPKRFKETNSVRQKRYRLRHIEQVRLWKIKYQNKRYRSMGTVPLNEPFKGCQGHHIDKNHIIYIPKEVHRSIWHNHKNPESMIEINKMALEYLKQR